ncbi:MAG: polyphosphate glucokinase [Chloroflexi bacterium 44-23]|nr:MAG: polyphosphate glucokinase [Chloroflexi bacterium 44-23]
MEILGLDIGGTGIKGAIVNTETGSLITDRQRIPTPEGSAPKDMADAISKIIDFFGYRGAIGCGFPAVIQHGIARTAANISDQWTGMNVNKFLTDLSGSPAFTLNDADAAGIAEMKFGAGREYQQGVVILLTIGTGIGSAIFSDGVLLPNTEFGHLQIRGKDAEQRASDAVRQLKEMSWRKWALALDEFLLILEGLFSPDLFVIGGGVSKKWGKVAPFLTIQTNIVPAQSLNQAGIIGAALYAQDQVNRSG